MADRADAAQALHRDRNFPIGAPLDERLEAAKLDDVQADLMNAVVLVEQDRHLAVALDARQRFDRDPAQLVRSVRCFQVGHGGGSRQS